MNTAAPLASMMRRIDLVRLGATIRHEYLRDEAALVTSKWPAYRFQSPDRLNRLFRDTYNKACSDRRPRDPDGDADVFGGIGPKLRFDKGSGQLTQLHQARQHADSLGMPYGDYIDFCFDFCNRSERKFTPRPNQLAPSRQAAEAWRAKLEKYWTDDRIWVGLISQADLERYDIRNDLGLPAQSFFREELLRLASGNVTNPATFYGAIVLQRRWLRPKEMMEADAEIWSRARQLAEADDWMGGFISMPHVPLDQMTLMQSCFGVPGIDTATEETCLTCPARQACDLLRDDVSRELRLRSGFDDPMTEEKKRKSRERTRKSREAKKKTGASSSGSGS